MEPETTTVKKKYKRSTEAERAAVLEQFHRSDLSRKAFCRTHGVAVSTLSKWLTNAKRKTEPAVPVLFKEVRMRQVATLDSVPWAVEIVGPDGLLVRCREALPLHDLSWLLRGR